MSIIPPEDSAASLAKEIAQNLPIKELYNDALAPGVRQVGYAIEDMAKAIRLVTAPLQAAAFLQDRFRDFIADAIKAVPHERRIAPASSILGPTLEAIKFEPSGSELELMFGQLLSRASDASTYARVHPSYVRLIRDLSRDEAHILRDLRDENGSCGAEDIDGVTTYVFDDHVFPTAMMRSDLSLYIDRLVAANLVEVRNAHFDGRAIMMTNGGSYTDAIIRLTPLGQHFVSLVIPKL